MTRVLKRLFGWWPKKTDCEWVAPLLSAYIDNQVSAEQRHRMEAHLRTCASCSDELSSLRATVDLLRSLPVVPAPRSFTLPARAAPRPSLSPAFFYLRNATAAVAVLLVALLAGGPVLQQSMPMYGARPDLGGLTKQEVKVERAPSPQLEKVVPAGPPPQEAQPSAFSAQPAATAAAAAPAVAPAPLAPGTAVPEGVGGAGDSGRAAKERAPDHTTTAPAAASQSTPVPDAQQSPTAEAKALALGQAPAAPAPVDGAAGVRGTASIPPQKGIEQPAVVADQYTQSYPWPALWVIQSAVAGALALLASATAAVWLRERRRWGG